MDKNIVVHITVALLFAIAFSIIGWTAPVLYASHAPSENFIEVNDFTAQDASTEALSHYICFDRTSRQSASATIFTELYLVADDGTRVEVEAKTFDDDFIEKGRKTVAKRMTLPPDLEEGTYRYLLITELSLADGRVERAFTFESEPFEIGPEYPDDPTEGQPLCS